MIMIMAWHASASSCKLVEAVPCTLGHMDLLKVKALVDDAAYIRFTWPVHACCPITCPHDHLNDINCTLIVYTHAHHILRRAYNCCSTPLMPWHIQTVVCS